MPAKIDFIKSLSPEILFTHVIIIKIEKIFITLFMLLITNDDKSANFKTTANSTIPIRVDITPIKQHFIINSKRSTRSGLRFYYSSQKRSFDIFIKNHVH